MKIRVAIVVLALVCLSGYVATTWTPPSSSPEPRIVQPAPDVPAGSAALSGVWEGMGPDDLPIRVVVEDVHENWAIVTYTWGEHPDGRFQKGWVRVRAKVLPDGKLFWRHPGDFTFRLSEDWTTLVGIREHWSGTANSLMRRVPSGVALNTLASGTKGQ